MLRVVHPNVVAPLVLSVLPHLSYPNFLFSVSVLRNFCFSFSFQLVHLGGQIFQPVYLCSSTTGCSNQGSLTEWEGLVQLTSLS